MVLATVYIISSRTGVLKVYRLTYNKLTQIKSLFTLLLNGLIFVVLGVDAQFLKRLIIDLMLKGLSLNQLKEHIKLIYGLGISDREIRKIENEAAEKAAKLNLQIDKQVAPKIQISEVDEIFQGQNTVTLGAVAKKYNYCMGLQWCPDRTKESISAFLKPIAKRFFNVKIVVTDLYSGYKDLISTLFKKAVHLVCHLHAGRLLRKSLRHLSSVLSHKKKELEKILKEIKTKTKQIEKTRKRIDFLSDRVKKDQTTTKMLLQKKQEKAKKCTKTVDNKLTTLENRIQKDEKELKELREKRDRLKKEEGKLPPQQKTLEKKIKDAQQDLLQSARLNSEFRKLMKDLTPNFPQHKEKFMNRLTQSKFTLAKEIHKMIQDNPDLFSVRNSRILAWNYQNTNSVEGLFSLYRRLLDSTRLLSSEAGSARYCDLFRLYHNTMPPFTGPHRDQSPAELLGYKLKGKSYLDLLYPLHGRKTRFYCDVKSEVTAKTINFHVVSSLQNQMISVCT